MATAQSQTKDQLSFGPFKLLPGERLLTKDDVAVDLGARALDILMVLASSPNEVVSKRDLMARVWPDVTVEEGSLRFHMNGLRKALGDGQDGARYVATLPGRGYCFVAPLSRTSRSRHDAALVGLPLANLPGRLHRMVGRDDDVRAVADRLNSDRFVSVVGAGGVGKTTVAVAVGNELTEAFGGAVLLVDLGMVGDPELVATAVASLLGLSVQSTDATPSIVAYLRDKRILLILDSCEHVVEAAADLASRILAAAPEAHILATSRETLRAEGEHVYRLGPLAYPPDDLQLTAAATHTFAAAQLFVERAAAGGARLEFDDADAAIVGGICRRLDGVALAIELAARRVEAFGLQQTAALLDQRLALLWQGSRTAPPRQKTLRATLDWSYELLSEAERRVLRRLAIFVGHFPIDAALAVASDLAVDQAQVFAAIDSLVAKSMVATRPVGSSMRYRLLDTTRAYLLDLDIDPNELNDLAARHAARYRQWCNEAGADWPTLSNAADRARHVADLNNVRVALEWAFGPGGDTAFGVDLACAATPVFLAMSLLPECHRWSEQAIGALGETRGGLAEMHLQAALGVSLLFMRGGCDPAREALDRAFAIAERRGEALDQVRMLGPLHVFCIRTASFKAALSYARRCANIASTTDDPVAIALGHAILGFSLHQCGDLAGARAELEAAASSPRAPGTLTVHLGFEGELWAGAMLAKTLWLQGHPVQAVARARQAVDDAGRMDHSLTLSIVLIWSITVFLYTGDLDSAEEHIDWLIARGESHSMAPYVAVGHGFRGALAILRGEADTGVSTLQASLTALHNAPYELLSTPLTISLIEGLAATARNAEGMALTDETIAQVEHNGDDGYLPELLRLRGRLLQSMGRHEEAGDCLTRSLHLSRRQGARAWELRATTDLASLWAGQDRAEDARALLRPLFAQFTEGADTADLKSAERLLASLR